LNTDVEQIERKTDGYYIGSAGPFDKVVYTGDLRRLKKILSSNEVSHQLSDHLATLTSNGTSNIFCETDPGDISWLYLPDGTTRAHRIIYTGTFAPSNNRGSQRHTCVVEFSGDYSYDFMCEEIKKLPGNLNPLGWNQEPNSYILHSPETKALVDEARLKLKGDNIYLLGRFAEWEYYNMDKAIEAAMQLNKELA